ncbi:MAG: cytochrome c biogenesis protein CcdA [Pelagimonas sp.]|jgi:cytochrome c-type biogenesis protein|nr:cytochrome c biogenesis protein CcdA [Pelagimonas sp.]
MDVTHLGAFLAGLGAFFTPCVLPMVPFYLSYMAGLSMSELRADGGISEGARKRLVISGLMFALGVTTLFMALGMGATALGRAFDAWLDWLRYAAALIILLFGLHFLGVIKIGILYREARMESKSDPSTALGAYVMGLAFGFGWTACVGPILATILMIATTLGEVWRGGILLMIFGLGMTLPFVVAAIFAQPFLKWMQRHREKLKYTEKVIGVMLVLFAILIATNSVRFIADAMLRLFPNWV